MTDRLTLLNKDYAVASAVIDGKLTSVMIGADGQRTATVKMGKGFYVTSDPTEVRVLMEKMKERKTDV